MGNSHLAKSCTWRCLELHKYKMQKSAQHLIHSSGISISAK